MGIPKDSQLGYGLMNFTWRPTQTPDEQAFAAIKAAVDGGSPMLNSGEFYGQPEPTLGLQLLKRFYEANPDYIDKTYLAVKGGINKSWQPDGSAEFLRESVTHINEVLGGKKKMDLFEMARVDKKTGIETTMKNLLALRDEGHFKDIGLSECSADTVRRAARVGPVAAVEVEYSPWSLDIENNGVLAACEELGIPVVAYSPLGRGFLAGTIKSIDDIPEGDMRRNLDRYQPGNFEKNLELVKKLEAIAQKKGVTPAQLSLAWLMAQSPLIHPIPGSTRLEGVKESLGALQVRLSEEDKAEIRKVVDSAEIVGGRYNDHHADHLEG